MSITVGKEEIETRLRYQAPNALDVDKCNDIRREAEVFALSIDAYLPDCREKSLAMTKLEEATMWAIAGMDKRS